MSTNVLVKLLKDFDVALKDLHVLSLANDYEKDRLHHSDITVAILEAQELLVNKLNTAQNNYLIRKAESDKKYGETLLNSSLL